MVALQARAATALQRWRHLLVWTAALAALSCLALLSAFGRSLPTLLHTFTFSLFTAVALRRGGRGGYAACIAWCAVNVVFEVGQHQHWSAHLAALMHGGLRQQLVNCLLRGTFDVGEMIAAVAGALLAAAVLRWIPYDGGGCC